MSYRITEPHPTAKPNQIIHTGRGGSGNMYKVKDPKETNSRTPLHNVTSNFSSSSQRTTTKFSSGRGGAGNIHPLSVASPFSLDKEIDQQTAQENSHNVWHVGRGGAGNWTRKDSVASSSRKMSNESADSSASSRSGFFGRLSGVFERH